MSEMLRIKILGSHLVVEMIVADISEVLSVCIHHGHSTLKNKQMRFNSC